MHSIQLGDLALVWWRSTGVKFYIEPHTCIPSCAPHRRWEHGSGQFMLWRFAW